MRHAKPRKRDLKNVEFHLLVDGRFALEEQGDRVYWSALQLRIREDLLGQYRER